MDGDGETPGPAPLWTDGETPVPLGDREANRSRRASNGGDPTMERSGDVASSAADFTPERMLRTSVAEPLSGWRLGIFRLTGGLVRLKPGAEELRRRELIGHLKTPIRGCRKIAFISRKGGVGKTTTCLMAGHTFATHRGDRVIALDGNPDAGTLGHRLHRETAATVAAVLAGQEVIERYADIRAFTSQAPSRLEVIAADDDPRITEALDEREIQGAIRQLDRHYNLVCLDTGTGVLHSATRGILGVADQIVVVVAPSLDGARAASSTLDWLDENGYRHLVERAVAVINAVRAGNGWVDLDRIEAHFSERCRAAVRIPWDPQLEAGAETAVEELDPSTRNAYLELAAAIAVDFAEPAMRRS